MANVVEVRELRKSFGETPVLKGVDLTLAKGETLGFLGPNGAGKTTVMRILTGLLAPDSGSVQVLGQNPCSDNFRIFSRIGYMPENPPLHHEMRVGEYLGFAAALKMASASASERVRAIDSAIDKCGLKDVVRQIIATLSKGYRQRVGLAQALVHGPELIIMDEPTGGLDPVQMAAMRESVMAVSENTSIMFSSHDLHLASGVCHRFALIHNGRITIQGNRKDLLRAAGRSGVAFFRVSLPVAEISGNCADITECSDQASIHGAPAVALADALTHFSQSLGEGADCGDGIAGANGGWSTETSDERGIGSSPVVSVKREGQTLAVRMEGVADPWGPVTRFLVEQGWDVLEVGRQEPHLEEVFLDITRGEVEDEI
ncbi:MAG: hypothetical protein CVV64_01115 [Candidatus Wallbacteria bacterium HGW-Wallbacteria-1]|jgi:ABC-2 type transport system ATP-binding protein|uniref:ABC transporter domain-containing protein n=1 Tax=Candidatus Wallbacteria bacterium HGW-Wallbacteria-1 TaxID=2013854 RepID=A0A2N1PUN6_9BACT|nr:MAG: hypothetical protein CVV64_01115 [Candidatus Wallbacteria bacterium HGW-Wallbacteria-1]